MAITDIHDIIIYLLKELTLYNIIETIYDKFSEISEIYSKVNFVERILSDFGYIEKLMKINLRDGKCNKKSSEYRKQGNKEFSLKNRKYFEALELYNKSICYAEPGSENLAIGYANRSAVLFGWKCYRECLANIELARKGNYPKHLMPKLYKREKQCLQLLDFQRSEIRPYDFKMNFAAHPNLPNIADCLKMRQTPKEGRHIYTTQDLAVGELIAIEEPFCSVLMPPMCYTRCANCKRENYLTLIPCEDCCSTMFCSEECREISMKSFHKYECPIIDFLHEMLNGCYLTALRVSLSAIQLFPTVEELMDFCNNPANQNKSVFDLDYMNLTPKEHYRAVHGLVTNQHLRPIDDLFQISLKCAVIKRFIIEYTPLKDFFGGKDGEIFFTELLFRHLQISAVNAHSINVVDQLTEKCTEELHSGAIFPFQSLLNHSCVPNTVEICKGTKMYLFALRPIAAGGILYTDYVTDFVKPEKLERLSIHYQFICQCEACKNVYPDLEQMPVKAFVPYIHNMNDRRKLANYDFDFALKTYKRCCNILNRYDSSYPCLQICVAKDYLQSAMYILADSVPLKAKINLTNI